MWCMLNKMNIKLKFRDKTIYVYIFLASQAWIRNVYSSFTLLFEVQSWLFDILHFLNLILQWLGYLLLFTYLKALWPTCQINSTPVLVFKGYFVTLTRTLSPVRRNPPETRFPFEFPVSVCTPFVRESDGAVGAGAGGRRRSSPENPIFVGEQ